MRKLFTFLLALVVGIGLCWAQSTTVTWISTDFTELGDIATPYNGIQLSNTAAFFVHEREWGYERVIDLRFCGMAASFSTTNSDLVFTKIEVSGGWHDDEESYFEGEGWSDSEDGRVWTGQAATVPFNLYMLTDDTGNSPWTIVFTLASAGPAKYTLRLLADPEKGSVALQNPSSDIVLNFDDSYNVPEGAEVTILATPLEGYEFSGWRVGSIYEMCYYDYCGGDVLSTNDNPLTVTMTADVAYVADFAAAAPQPVVLADCGLGWLNVPEGGVVGTIGHEDEIVLPQVNASSDFILAFQAHTATLRLGSTDESVLAVYGFNNFAVNGVGECDVYVVHDEDAVFAYDSAAFHVTVNPEPTPQPAQQVITWSTQFCHDVEAYYNMGQIITANNSKDGITVTYSGSDVNDLDGMRIGGIFLTGGTNSKMTFTSTVGNISKIEVYYYTNVLEDVPVGWTHEVLYDKFVWEGTPAASVDMMKGADRVGFYIRNIDFTIGEAEPAPQPQPAGNLKLIEFQVPASWENDNTPISIADFPDFVATTYEIASALPVTSDEPSIVVFDFPGDDENSVYSKAGGQVSQPSTGTMLHEDFFEHQTQIHYYYPVLAGDEPAPQPQTIHDSDDAATIETFLSTNHGTEIAELTIDRPVYNNMYNTLCLPFDMDAAQIAASSLNGVEIFELEEVTVANDELFLGLSDAVNAVVAGRPYIVKYSAASQLDDLDFENVTINNADLDDEAITMNGVTFKGTFTPFEMGIQNGFDTNGGYLFLGQNNVLYWPNTNNPLKPFRAYFYIDLNSGSSNAPLRFGMPARIGRPAQVPTGVENVQSDKVQSTKVIENGQLIIIKNGVKYNAQGQVIK